MPLVDPSSVLNQTIIDEPERAVTVAGFGDSAEERMRDLLTGDRTDDEIPLTDYPAEADHRLRLRDRGDIYDDIVDQVGFWDTDDKDRLKKAETYWAFAEALPHLNIRISDAGGLIREEGFSENTTRLKSESQIAQTQQGIKTQAIRMARGLLSRHNRDDPDPVYVL